MLTSAITAVVALIQAYPHLAYAVVFLLATSESMPIIGLMFPGTAVILAISALIPSGVVTLWPVLISMCVGAIIGDGISFWIGHRYKQQVLGVWPLNKYPGLISRSEAFFAIHGDKSVFIARFVPGVRAIIPLFAGISGMPVRRFYVANVLSALAWSISHVFAAVFVGASIGQLGEAAKPIAILIAILVLGSWLSFHILRLALRKGVPMLASATGTLRGWASRQDNVVGRVLSGMLDTSGSEARWLFISACVVIVAARAFFGILEDVVTGDPLVQADKSIFQGLQALRTIPGDVTMITITELGDTAVVIPVVAAVFLFLAWKRAWRAAAYWILAVAGASAINTMIKVTLLRARPGDINYTGWSIYSFPSGHSTINFVLYGFLAILIARELRPAWHIAVASAVCTFALCIAFSRLYLGAHWFSDVVGGLSFGTMWLTILAFFYLRGRTNRIAPGQLIAVALAALTLAGGTNIYRHHSSDIARYAVQPKAFAGVWEQAWLAHAWKDLPSRRVDLTGEIEEPFTFQWAGSLPALEARLASDGWHRPMPLLSRGVLSWLAADSSPQDVPVLPMLSSGRSASLVLIRQNPADPVDSRLVLRLWAADILIVDGNRTPLWMGSVVEERLTRPLSLLTLTNTATGLDKPRDVLARALTPGALVERERASAVWDGRVLLVRERQ